MKIFLDTIDLKIIKRFYEMGVLYGVTTNPTLAKRFGMADDIEMVKKIRKVMPFGEIHVEAFGNSSSEILENALRINSLTKDEDLVFKVPFSDEGVKATKCLKQQGFKTNLHLIFSANQSLIAASVGSDYICPLVGRLDDIGHDALQNVELIKKCFKNYSKSIDTKIMVSSVRHPQHVSTAFQKGADVITIPAAVLDKMLYHPLTAKGYSAFHQDIRLMQTIQHDEINRDCVIDPNMSLKDCLQYMYERKINMVVSQQDSKIGTCTMGDVKRILVEESFKIEEIIIQKISNFLNFDCVKIDVNCSYEDAHNLSIKNNTKELVVIDNNKLLGSISI